MPNPDYYYGGGVDDIDGGMTGSMVDTNQNQYNISADDNITDNDIINPWHYYAYDDVIEVDNPPSVSRTGINIVAQDLLETDITKVESLDTAITVLGTALGGDSSLLKTESNSIDLSTLIIHNFVAMFADDTAASSYTIRLNDWGRCCVCYITTPNNNALLSLTHANEQYPKNICVPNNTTFYYQYFGNGGTYDSYFESDIATHIIKFGDLPNAHGKITLTKYGSTPSSVYHYDYSFIDYDVSIGDKNILSLVEDSATDTIEVPDSSFKIAVMPNQKFRLNKSIIATKIDNVNSRRIRNTNYPCFRSVDPNTGVPRDYYLQSNLNANIVYSYNDFIFYTYMDSSLDSSVGYYVRLR